MATGMFENDASGNCLPQQPPGVPDSPDSIPLPDSPPPETEERVVGLDQGPPDIPPEEPDRQNNNNNEGVLNNMPHLSSTASSGTNNNSSATKSGRKGSRKPRLAEEYDPSEPLTSSDEEEHSLLLIEGTPNSRSSGGGANTHNNETKCSDSSSGISVVDPSRLASPLRLASPPRLSTTPPPPVAKTTFSSVVTIPIVSNSIEQNTTPANNTSSNSNSNTTSSSNSNSKNVNNSRLDISSIPVPPEENRRPTIHFSIPTRHRLLPISSLIKRQKGGGKKDGGTGGQLADGFRGSEKSGDADDEDEEDELEERPKISLVAEIFGGTDDEDEENEDETDGALQPQQGMQPEDKPVNDTLHTDSAAVTSQNNGIVDNGSQQTQPIIDAGRWKLVADEPTADATNNGATDTMPVPPPALAVVSESESQLLATPTAQSSETADNEAGEDEPEIIEIVTLNVPPTSRLRPLRRRPIFGRLGVENGGEPEVIDIDQDDEEEAPVVPAVVAPTASSPPPPPVPPTAKEHHHHGATPSPPRRSSSSLKDISTNSENDREKRHGSRASPVNGSPVRPERHFKRPHSSSSVSNCEEGEIVDSVNKKRKKDKKKKAKRRKRSKDSMSPSPSSSKLPEKRLSDGVPPTASTSDHEDEGGSRGGGSAISWRKPSKRTQNRNYRDGKPKADDTFFREKEVEEKQKNVRGEPSGSRKERSPVKDKSNRHRRDNRSHSKSPTARKASRSRSRSSSKAYRSRRRNRHSRSRSSVSDKSRSDRSSSRRRSRKRYRRSTSRHHAGDSRSPSYITEPIRSRSSHYSKFRDRSRSRSRDKHRGRHRNKRSVTRSRTPSPRGHKKNRKPESEDRQHKKKQIKEKEKHHQQQLEATLSDSKEKRREKEKLKEKERRKKKEKEKPKEEEKSKQPKEKPKEKEKKKKRKRREKSPTPVKAIVADGDSIVVSLSFQKGKTASSSSNAPPASVTVEERKENGLDDSTSTESPSKPKPTSSPTKNACNNDPAESINEFNEERERTPSSPAKLSSVTDEEEGTTSADPNSAEGVSKSSKPDEKETEPAKVTSSAGAPCGSNSPFEGERPFNSAPDSTKTTTPQPCEQQEIPVNHSVRSSSSPTTEVESNAQGDTLVTSTGDSIPGAVSLGTEDETKSNTSSTPSKQQTESNKLFPSLPVKVTASSVSPRGTTQTTTASGETATATATTSATSTPVNSGSTSSAPTNTSQSSVTPTVLRPLIGNIPGLYPSSAIIGGPGAGPVPPPIVIPTPPPPRPVMYTTAGGPSTATPMLNPNVLASVASALLAVRTQNQPTGGKGQVPTNNNSDMLANNSLMRNFHTLGPKPQNFNSHQQNLQGVLGNRSYNQGQDSGGGGGGGESPMSPNSSDGDDLFEPPMDSSKNGQLFPGMPTAAGAANPNDSFNTSSGANKPNDRGGLFDTLFGVGGAPSGPRKPTPNKPEKLSKARVKHRKGIPKKEIIKVNTSGGLTEGELRLTDEVPTSAVELIVKQKYLKKLNRQERVVEEVKLALKPYYSKRQVNKDEYKEILRRAVPKICHNKTGEINPGKIKELVDAYVKKFRHARKRGLDLSSVK